MAGGSEEQECPTTLFIKEHVGPKDKRDTSLLLELPETGSCSTQLYEQTL